MTTVPFGIPRRRGGDRAPISLLAPAAVAAIIALVILAELDLSAPGASAGPVSATRGGAAGAAASSRSA